MGGLGGLGVFGAVLWAGIWYLPRKNCMPPTVWVVRGYGKGCDWGMYEGRLEGLSCRVGDDCRRWYHICGSWYLPRPLLSDGSWMWMNIASLMVLE